MNAGVASAEWVWPNSEPEKLSAPVLNEALLWAYDRGYSDIFVSSDWPIYGSRNGVLRDLARRRVTTTELNLLLDEIYMRTASTSLQGQEDLDFAYEVQIARGRSARFRVNATAIVDAANVRLSGVDVTFRAIPEHPPMLREILEEPELLAVFERVKRLNGLVLVVGETGTGKTTLLAGMLDDILADEARRRVVTWEAPVEFVLARSPRRRGYVLQSEVGRHLRIWDQSVRNVLRRKPNVVLVGEVRDVESMRSLLEISRTGHLCFSTMHTNSVAAALSRFAGAFSAGERTGVSAQLVDSLRLIVHQRLLRRKDGGRVAVREWLEFDADVREEVQLTEYERRGEVVGRLVEARGHSLEAETRRLHTAGLVDDQELDVVLAEVGRKVR